MERPSFYMVEAINYLDFKSGEWGLYAESTYNGPDNQSLRAVGRDCLGQNMKLLCDALSRGLELCVAKPLRGLGL